MARHGRVQPVVACLWLVAACGLSPASPAATTAGSATPPNPPVATPSPASASPGPSAATAPEWYGFEMTDVLTGRPFRIGDFAGKVILVETMAEWCPTCIRQQDEVRRLHELLANPDEVVSISLDIDVHEDGPSLKEYATALGHDWRYAVAPLQVARALGNLYSAEYLNPPFSPMLLIDRQGVATSLPYGVKTAEFLQATIEPLLAAP